MIYQGIEVNNKSVPLPFEEQDIKTLHRMNPLTNKEDGDIYAFMCRHCGSIWTIHQTRCHEATCRYYEMPLDK
jgi:hypothetical protein